MAWERRSTTATKEKEEYSNPLKLVDVQGELPVLG